MTTNNTNEVYHHGIPGQKWGVRRYQNKDGSLTPAGRKRAEKLQRQYTELTGKKIVRKPYKKSSNPAFKKEDIETKKSIKDMSDNELREKTNRMRLENDYINTSKANESINQQQVSTGRKAVKHVWKNVISPAATDAGRRVLTDWLIKVGNEQLISSPKKVDPNSALKKEVETLELERRRLKATNDIANIKKKK